MRYFENLCPLPHRPGLELPNQRHCLLLTVLIARRLILGLSHCHLLILEHTLLFLLKSIVTPRFTGIAGSRFPTLSFMGTERWRSYCSPSRVLNQGSRRNMIDVKAILWLHRLSVTLGPSLKLMKMPLYPFHTDSGFSYFSLSERARWS